MASFIGPFGAELGLCDALALVRAFFGGGVSSDSCLVQVFMYFSQCDAGQG
jgi:hypothetical protein